MHLTSPAFQNGKLLPEKYAYHNQNLSPPLAIQDIPEKAQSLVLIVDDPDAPAGTWLHWLVFDLPIVETLEEGSQIGKKGINSFKTQKYDGPAPPSGVHHYFFKLYALDALLNLKEGATLKEVESSMKEHILAKAEIVGLFGKK